MKFRNTVSILCSIIARGCIYYTITSLLLYTGGLLFSTVEREWIPTLDVLLLLLLFTVSFSAANHMVVHAKLSMAVKMLIHYAVTLLIFYTVFILWGGFSQRASATFVLLLAFTVIYGIGALIFCIVCHVRSAKKNSRSHYDDQFKK